MRKVGLLALAGLLAMPVAAMSATDKDVSADDQRLVAASYQQGESAIDPSAPVTKPTAAADIAESAAAMADAATSASSTPTAVQPNDATSNSASAATKAPTDNADATEPAMIPLPQQVVDLHNAISQLQQQNDQFRQQLNEIEYTVYGLAGLVVLLALLSLARRGKKPDPVREKLTATPVVASSAATVKAEDDTQGEYDFMGSSEGIPAKLDLARAYIAMEDFVAARETLAEILSEGHEQHRNEARSLLTKINT